MSTTCAQCGGPLTEARAGLDLTLCSGACHRAARTEARLHAANNTIRDLTLEVAHLRAQGAESDAWRQMKTQRDAARADYAALLETLRDDLALEVAAQGSDHNGGDGRSLRSGLRHGSVPDVVGDPQ